eukprot:164404-Hanusia_phi.AAC.1
MKTRSGEGAGAGGEGGAGAGRGRRSKRRKEDQEAFSTWHVRGAGSPLGLAREVDAGVSWRFSWDGAVDELEGSWELVKRLTCLAPQVEFGDVKPDERVVGDGEQPPLKLYRLEKISKSLVLAAVLTLDTREQFVGCVLIVCNSKKFHQDVVRCLDREECCRTRIRWPTRPGEKVREEVGARDARGGRKGRGEGGREKGEMRERSGKSGEKKG